RAFAARHPQALELSFSNDAPLASGPTRLWLSQGSGGGGNGNGGAAASAGVEALIEAALGQGRALLLQGDFPQAVLSTRNALGAVRGRRGEFVARLALARLCLEGGKPELAQAQLVRLEADCERF